ncbi:MAG: hypothetical protein JWS12_954 [Candidatus Saccharibacteria bacterium]|nr:hypothetical protein [Candidatus Saccharibacteria bacterium]
MRKSCVQIGERLSMNAGITTATCARVVVLFERLWAKTGVVPVVSTAFTRALCTADGSVLPNIALVFSPLSTHPTTKTTILNK